MTTPRKRWAALADEVSGAPEVPPLSTSTVDPLVPLVGLALHERGAPRRVRAGAYGAVTAELAGLGAEPGGPSDVVVLAEFEGVFGSDPDDARAARDLERWTSALRGAAAHAHVWAALLVPPRPAALDDERLALARRADVALLEAAAAEPQLHVLDLPALLARHGEAAYDDRLWYLARQRFATAVLPDVAALVAAHVARRTPYKALALDCDGVLWGGVLGEDGIDGIKVGDTDPVGRAYVALQEQLVRLVRRGVLLALCSKNDERDVWEVLDRHPGMVLRREHVSAAAVSWDPKSAGIERIAADLGILPSAIVFLDDNPAEVAEVAAHLPDVLPVLAPGDPVALPGFVAAQEWFLTTTLTDEDRNRTAMVAAERERRAATTGDDFLADLELKIDIADVDDASFARVHQLLHKTNQFNLTVRRHDEAELRALLARPGWFGLTVTVSDRFGGYGLTGVALAGPEDGALLVDTFLLSCRVLGRQVEDALLAALRERARALGLGTLRVPVVETDRNTPALRFADRAGLRDEVPV